MLRSPPVIVSALLAKKKGWSLVWRLSAQRTCSVMCVGSVTFRHTSSGRKRGQPNTVTQWADNDSGLKAQLRRTVQCKRSGTQGLLSPAANIHSFYPCDPSVLVFTPALTLGILFFTFLPFFSLFFAASSLFSCCFSVLLRS